MTKSLPDREVASSNLGQRPTANGPPPTAHRLLPSAHPPRLPLDGVVVADFSRILAGPLCTMWLADMGARVIKIEDPRGGDETRRWGPPFKESESAYFLSINRSKESLTLDLKTSEGQRIAQELIRRADVVIENFLPASCERLGLAAEQVHQLNARAIHCSIRGYERESENADAPGYDLLAQAGAGLMSITGAADGPPMKVGVALADVLTAHHAFGAINAALYGREHTAVGAAVEVSIYGAAVASLVNVAQNYLITGERPKRHGNQHPSIVPYQSFSAADRDFAIGVASDRHFRVLCERVIERPELADEPRFATNAERVRNRDALIPQLEAIFRTAEASVWVERCLGAGIPAARVEYLDEIFEGDGRRLVASAHHASIGELPMVRNPVRIDGKPLPIRSAPPLLGEQTDAILEELGHDRRQIGELRARWVV